MTFYGSFYGLSTFILGCSVLLISNWGNSALSAVIWLKIMSLMISYIYVTKRNKAEFYYFLNMGFNKSSLWAWTLSIDVFLFILSLYLTLHIA